MNLTRNRKLDVYKRLEYDSLTYSQIVAGRLEIEELWNVESGHEKCPIEAEPKSVPGVSGTCHECSPFTRPGLDVTRLPTAVNGRFEPYLDDDRRSLQPLSGVLGSSRSQ